MFEGIPFIDVKGPIHITLNISLTKMLQKTSFSLNGGALEILHLESFMIIGTLIL